MSSCPLSDGSALAPWFSCVALALVLSSVGCGGVQAESLEGEEVLGQTEQAVLGSVLEYVNTIDRGFELGLSNIHGYAKPYYNIRYGVLGSPLSMASVLGGPFYVDGPYPGAPYTFSARACDGYLWGGGIGNPCSAWSAPVAATMPYVGSSWGYSDIIGADGIAGAWGAGYYPYEGANVALPVCSAFGDGAQYLGYWYSGACNIGYAGSLHTYPSAQVLLNVPVTAHWGAYTHGLVPHKAMRGGYYNGRSLYSCRTLYEDAYIPGWTYGDTCNIFWDGSYYAAPASASQILCF